MTNRDFRLIEDDIAFAVRASALVIKDNRLLTIWAEQLGKYYLPGGAIRVGEDTSVALKRELKEELGVDCQVGNLAFVVENLFELQDRFWHNIEFHYLVDIEGPLPEKVLEGSETRSLKWLPIDQLDRVDFKPTFLAQVLPNWTGSLQHIKSDYGRKATKASESDIIAVSTTDT